MSEIPPTYHNHLVLSISDGTDGATASPWSEAEIGLYASTVITPHGAVWELYVYDPEHDEFEPQFEFGKIDEHALQRLREECVQVWVGPGRNEERGFLLDVKSGIVEKVSGKDAAAAAIRMGFTVRRDIQPLVVVGNWPNVMELKRSQALSLMYEINGRNLPTVGALPTRGYGVRLGICNIEGLPISRRTAHTSLNQFPYPNHQLWLANCGDNRFTLESYGVPWWEWCKSFGPTFALDSLFMKRWKIYDAGDEYADRYTIFPFAFHKDKTLRSMYLGVDGNGGRSFSQWGEVNGFRQRKSGGCGKRIFASALPLETLRHAYYRAEVEGE